MENQSRMGVGSKLAGVAALLIGVLNIVLILYVVATPAGARFDAGEFYRNFAQNPLANSIAWIVFAITAVLAYAVIPRVSDLVQDVNRDWARAATIYGIVGFTVLGVWAITLTRTTPHLAQAFVGGDEVSRKALLAYGLPEIDPDGWFMFGGTGTWLIVMNILALHGKRLPRLQGIIGILSGACAWATVFGALFQFEPLNLIAAAGGAIFYTSWFIWLGIRFLRAASV